MPMLTVQQIDRIIATTLVEELLGQRFRISVHDGEDFVLKDSSDRAAILAAMFSTNEDTLYVEGGTLDTQGLRSFVKLIYGNSGWDLIADHGERLEPYIRKTEMLAKKLETGEEVNVNPPYGPIIRKGGMTIA